MHTCQHCMICAVAELYLSLDKPPVEALKVLDNVINGRGECLVVIANVMTDECFSLLGNECS